MPGCYWPCCGTATYNLRKYDASHAVVWSHTAIGGNAVTHMAHDAANQKLFVAGYGTDNTKNVIEKYDVSGASPSLEWGITKGAKYTASDWNGFKRLAVDASGNLIAMTSTTLPAYSPAFSGTTTRRNWIDKYSTAGTHTWRSNGITSKANTSTRHVKGNDFCIIGGRIYIGHEQYKYNSPTIPGFWYVGVTVLNSDSSYYSWIDPYFYTSPGFPFSDVSFLGLFPVDAVATDGTLIFMGSRGVAQGSQNGQNFIDFPNVTSYNVSTAARWSAPTENTPRYAIGVNSLTYNFVAYEQLIVGRSSGAMRFYDSTTGVYQSNNSTLSALYEKGVSAFGAATEQGIVGVYLTGSPAPYVYYFPGGNGTLQTWTQQAYCCAAFESTGSYGGAFVGGEVNTD